jgi:hypothetical protein
LAKLTRQCLMASIRVLLGVLRWHDVFLQIKCVLLAKPLSLSRRYDGQQDARIDYIKVCAGCAMTTVTYRLDVPIIAYAGLEAK